MRALPRPFMTSWRRCRQTFTSAASPASLRRTTTGNLADIARDVVADLLKLVQRTDVVPGLAEDPMDLALGDRRIGVPARRQAFAAGEAGKQARGILCTVAHPPLPVQPRITSPSTATTPWPSRLDQQRIDLGFRDIGESLVRQGRERRDRPGQRSDIAARQVAIAADRGQALDLLDHLPRLGSRRPAQAASRHPCRSRPERRPGPR